MEAQGRLLEAMDLLWFDQIILFPHTCKKLVSPTPKPALESPNFSLQKSFSEVSSRTTCSHEEIQRPRLIHHVRHHLSSPTWAKKESRKLEKTMSLGDLELEEVKGFMDLGFIFKKENLSSKMMRLIPGLRRLINTKYEINDQDEEEIIMRPYLSEAWVVKRPDFYYSPLINLGIGGDCSSSDIKKNLKCWARNVALVIQQEC